MQFPQVSEEEKKKAWGISEDFQVISLQFLPLKLWSLASGLSHTEACFKCGFPWDLLIPNRHFKIPLADLYTLES